MDLNWEMSVMKRRHKVFAAAVIAIVVIVMVMFYRETDQEWRHYQKSYNAKLADKLKKPEYLSEPLKIQQVWLPKLNTTDRCITCHLGVENPLLVNEPQPFTTHPGNIFRAHPIDKFGCTVCHQGDGQALTVEATHGVVHHLNRQLLAKEFVQSSCSKCHVELHDTSITDDKLAGVGIATLLQGRGLTFQYGCRACHTINGDGGNIGPELTGFGSKTELAFGLIHDFAHIEGPHVKAEWEFEHFLDPQKVVPGNRELNFPPTIMPKFGFSNEQARALTIYVLNLRNPKVDNIPYEYIAKNSFVKTPSRPVKSSK